MALKRRVEFVYDCGLSLDFEKIRGQRETCQEDAFLDRVTRKVVAQCRLVRSSN